MKNKTNFFYSLLMLICFLLPSVTIGQGFCYKHIKKAKVHLLNNKLRPALKELQEAQYCYDGDNKFTPEIEEVQNKIFDALEQQKEDAEAKQQCEDLLKENEKRKKILNELNDWMNVKEDIENRFDNLREELSSKQKANDSLVKIYTSKTKKDSINYKNWLQLFHVYSKTRKSNAEKLKIIKKAIVLNEKSPLLYVLRGIVYYNMSNYQAAEKDGLIAIKLNPYYPRAKLLLANIKSSTNDIKTAKDFINTVKILDLNDDNTSALHTSLGFIYMSENDYTKALKSANEALSINSDNADALRVIGGVHYKKEKYDLALIEYTKAIEIDNKSKRAYVDRGEVYRKLGDYKEAISDYEKALNLDSDYASAYNGIAIVYHSQKKYDSALVNYTKAISIESHAIYFSNRGNLHDDMNQREKAIKDYENAIELNPDYSHAYNGLALQYYYLENYDKALNNFNAAIEKDSINLYAYRNKGILLNKVGKYSDAIKSYYQAIVIDPNNAYTHKVRGDAYNNLNMYKEVLSDYKKAEKIAPKIYNNLSNDIKYLEILVENPIKNLSELDSENLKFTKLSFYPDHYLAEQKIRNQNGKIDFFKFYITDSKQNKITSILSGTNIPIYKLNSSLHISLTNENIKEYVIFFFKQTHGKHGSFQVINSINDIIWKENITSKEKREAMKYINKALSSLPKNINKTVRGWEFKKLINFKKSLFITTVKVSNQGNVSIVDEDLLYEDWEIPANLWNSKKGYYFQYDPSNTTLLDIESEILFLNKRLKTITTIPLSFYPDYSLRKYEVEDEKYKYYIYKNTSGSNVEILNGTSSIIHNVNADAPIKLSQENVSEFLNFFCYHVHGDEGAFQIINSVNDIVWDYTKKPENIQKSKDIIQTALANTDFSIKKEGNNWVFKRLVHYGHALFSVEFKIYADGKVEMLNDEPVESNMPTKVLKVDGESYKFLTPTEKETTD